MKGWADDHSTHEGKPVYTHGKCFQIHSKWNKKKNHKSMYLGKKKKEEKKRSFHHGRLKKSGFYSAHWLRVSLIKTNCLILTGQTPMLLLALAPLLSGKKRGKSTLAAPHGRWMAPVFRFLAQAAFPTLWKVRGPAWRWHRRDLSLVTAPPHYWHSSLEKAILRALSNPATLWFFSRTKITLSHKSIWCPILSTGGTTVEKALCSLSVDIRGQQAPTETGLQSRLSLWRADFFFFFYWAPIIKISEGR